MSGPIGTIKSNWRVMLLVLFVGGALFALFMPGGVMSDDPLVEDDTVDDNPTNIEYGLGLDGGTRISAPPVGMTAEDIGVEPDEAGAVEGTLIQELEIESADARVEYHEDDDAVHAEVFTDEVDEDDFARALGEAGVEYDAGDIRDGVTQLTRDDIIRTIELKINEAGLSGGSVYQEQTIEGIYYIVTEVPDMDPDELRALLQERGVVEIVAYHPTEDGGQTNTTVLERDDLDSIGSPSFDDQQGQHYVPVTLSTAETNGQSPAERYQSDMNELGFTGEGIGQCNLHDRDTGEFNYDNDTQQWCLVTEVDGEPVDAHSMGDRLGQSMADGTFASDPTFRMIVPTQQDANTLSVNLNAGALRAPLDFSQEQTFSLSPALADQFKIYSLLIGILSVLTVSGMVYLRYRDPRVALPMIVTAMSEVVILLGFAALIRMPLDLSHVAGFIAVVGTGVDDLIIIADQVMDEGEVNSKRVFESRFRKAFWIIGAAAATTIIAMSPLAVLSLGDLRGFAIITILGVLVGVLITRPAYGDILEYLLTDDK